MILSKDTSGTSAIGHIENVLYLKSIIKIDI